MYICSILVCSVRSCVQHRCFHIQDIYQVRRQWKHLNISVIYDFMDQMHRTKFNIILRCTSDDGKNFFPKVISVRDLKIVGIFSKWT